MVTPKIDTFRKLAQAACKEQRLSELELPGIEQWFLASVVPGGIKFPHLEEAKAIKPIALRLGDLQQQEVEQKEAEALTFLQRILADGPKEANEAKQFAKAEGVSSRQLFRAKAKVGATSIKRGMRGPVYWCLPGQAPAVEPPAAQATPTREQRERPAKKKHLQWKAWKNAGMSYGQIRDEWERTTGETVSRDTVIKGIQRAGGNTSST